MSFLPSSATIATPCPTLTGSAANFTIFITRSRHLPVRGASASIVLLHLATAGLVVTGLFHSDVNVPRPPASASALVHWIGAGISFLSLMIAIFLLSSCFKHDARWQAVYRLSCAWGVAIVLALAAYGALAILDWTGIGERIYIAVSIFWLLFVSLRLRSIALHLVGAD